MRREVDDGVLLVRRGNFPQQIRPYHSSLNTTFYAGTHKPRGISINQKAYSIIVKVTSNVIVYGGIRELSVPIPALFTYFWQ